MGYSINSLASTHHHHHHHRGGWISWFFVFCFVCLFVICFFFNWHWISKGVFFFFFFQTFFVFERISRKKSHKSLYFSNVSSFWISSKKMEITSGNKWNSRCLVFEALSTSVGRAQSEIAQSAPCHIFKADFQSFWDCAKNNKAYILHKTHVYPGG